MPEIDLKVYENIPPAELESRRRAIITKAAGLHDNLSIDELHELAALTGVLRRRASGPPRPTTRTKSTTMKPSRPSVMDLA